MLGYLSAGLLLAPWFGALTAIFTLVLFVWLSSPGAVREPWFREQGVNLEAWRGTPKVWLVAHVDSKSQPVPTAVRSLGVILVAIALSGQFVVRWPIDRYFYAIGVLGGLILLTCSVGSRSDGAADNASGVAAVLDAAALFPRDLEVGVLITDAEELALAGASAWVAGKPKGVAVNCDTIDDEGRFSLFQYGPRMHALDEVAVTGLRAVEEDPRVGKAPIGVLTDSNAFQRAGWKSVTLARGTIRTLGRIHTRRDSLDHLRGTGIEAAAKVLARIVEELS